MRKLNCEHFFKKNKSKQWTFQFLQKENVPGAILGFNPALAAG